MKFRAATSACHACPLTGKICSCREQDCFLPLYIVMLGLVALVFATEGCVPAAPMHQAAHFETERLDSCLTLVVDRSGSFTTVWDERGYALLTELMDQFFTETAGGESRIVISQLSGSEDAVLFEGSPADLRNQFPTAASLNEYLALHSDPGGSPVYRATQLSIDYVTSMPRVTEETRLLTVILSDMADTQTDHPKRVASGKKMLASLKRYEALGGGLALYFVSTREIKRWRQILDEAGFEPGSYVIESTLVAKPTLPRFE